MTQALTRQSPFRLRLHHLRPPSWDGECVNGPEHQWVGMHLAWNGGANDTTPAQATTRAGPYVPLTMGYYTRQDIPIHHLLADTFRLRRLPLLAAGRAPCPTGSTG